MQSTATISAAARSRSPITRIGSYLAAFARYRRERRALAQLSEMSDELLSDIGLTRAQVQGLQERPFRTFIG